MGRVSIEPAELREYLLAAVHALRPSDGKHLLAAYQSAVALALDTVTLNKDLIEFAVAVEFCIAPTKHEPPTLAPAAVLAEPRRRRQAPTVRARRAVAIPSAPHRTRNASGIAAHRWSRGRLPPHPRKDSVPRTVARGGRPLPLLARLHATPRNGVTLAPDRILVSTTGVTLGPRAGGAPAHRSASKERTPRGTAKLRRPKAVLLSGLPPQADGAR